MSAAVRRIPQFRKHHASESSWLPVIAVCLLGIFDVSIIVYLVHGIYVFSR